MGNTPSQTASGSGSSGKRRSKATSSSSPTRTATAEDVAARAQQVVGELHTSLRRGMRKWEENDHPAAQLIDTVCGPYLDPEGEKYGAAASFYSEDYISEDDSRTVSEDDETATTAEERQKRKKKSKPAEPKQEDLETVESASYLSQSDLSSKPKRNSRRSSTEESSYDTEDAPPPPQVPNKPLASAFAKRCYFTKAGIGKGSQHYEGLTLTGNVVLMLAAAMKLKGCPTICDEDLRRVEQTYPNQFSRLPDELLLSSGWRRISKFCHFSAKPIPDGVPFFHSKQRLHTAGGYYFLLAAAVGMVRPIDVEPLNRDTLVLLETDFPTACDAAPGILIQDPHQWTLVDKFCFFSGGPINTDEDVYYQADFDGNPIYMLAFLSPSLTPAELYKLHEGGLQSVQEVQQVESVYDLTERDFDDLRLYHLGPCRALPQYILQPQAWTKVLPPHFLAARQTALLRSQDYEARHGMQQQQQQAPFAAAPQQQQQQQQLSVGSARGFMDQQQQQHPHAVQQQPGHWEPQQQQPSHYYGAPQDPMSASPPSTAPEVYMQQQQPQPDFGAYSSVPSDTYAAAQAAYSNQRMYGQPHPSQQSYGFSDADGGYGNYPPPQQRQPEGFIPSTEPTFPAQLHPHTYGPPPVEEKPQQQQPYMETASSTVPMDEAMDARHRPPPLNVSNASNIRMDPPADDQDEPPSLSKQRQPEEDVYSPAMSQEPNNNVYYEEDAMNVPHDDDDDDDNAYYPSPQQPFSPVSESEFMSNAEDTKSPSSEISQSSAMKGAQEMLRRNRLRRAEKARKNAQALAASTNASGAPEDEAADDYKKTLSPDPSPTRTDSESGVTWESGSEMTSVVSGSSVWTDHTNPDRSSRRALILQMAKARMKSNKTGASVVTSAVVEEETSFEEKKVEPAHDMEDLLTGDLD